MAKLCIMKQQIMPHPNTLVWCMYLIHHSKLQIQSLTTSMGHVAINFLAGNVELSLQLPGQSHMPQFLQHNHTGNKEKLLLI